MITRLPKEYLHHGCHPSVQACCTYVSASERGDDVYILVQGEDGIGGGVGRQKEWL